MTNKEQQDIILSSFDDDLKALGKEARTSDEIKAAFDLIFKIQILRELKSINSAVWERV